AGGADRDDRRHPAGAVVVEHLAAHGGDVPSFQRRPAGIAGARVGEADRHAAHARDSSFHRAGGARLELVERAECLGLAARHPAAGRAAGPGHYRASRVPRSGAGDASQGHRDAVCVWGCHSLLRHVFERKKPRMCIRGFESFVDSMSADQILSVNVTITPYIVFFHSPSTRGEFTLPLMLRVSRGIRSYAPSGTRGEKVDSGTALVP